MDQCNTKLGKAQIQRDKNEDKLHFTSAIHKQTNLVHDYIHYYLHHHLH